jgi:hypothetical protein
MKAFHGKQELKAEVLAELRGHREADRLVKGQYWGAGKGCAVGCLLKSGNHIEYEERFGISVALARLEDTLFEGMPNDKAMLWPERFMDAFNVGADTSRVHWAFLHWLLTEEIKIVGEGKVYDDVRTAVKRISDLMAVIKDGGSVDKDAARAARAADTAARAARAAYAAYADARAARAAYAAYAAARAARAADYAAYAADYAAYAAAYAAYAAAYAAYAAAYADADTVACYARMADKLVDLIKEVKT